MRRASLAFLVVAGSTACAFRDEPVLTEVDAGGDADGDTDTDVLPGADPALFEDGGASPCGVPQDPSVRGTFHVDFTPGGIAEYAIAAAGDVLAVGLDERGVEVFDVSDPGRPTRVAANANLQVARLAFAGTNLVGVGTVGGDPSVFVLNPLRGSVDVVGTMGLDDFPDAMALLDETHVFIGGWDTLQVIDVSDPSAPRVAASVPFDDGVGVGEIAIAGDLAVTCTDRGALVWDVSDPAVPSHLKTIRGVREPAKLAMSGSYLFATSGDLAVFNVTEEDPEAIAYIPFDDFPVHGAPVAFHALGDLLLTTDIDDEIHFIDVADPANPEIVRSVRLPSGRAVAMAATGNRAYLHVHDDDVHIVDLDCAAP